jgi:hypothetical protein
MSLDNYMGRWQTAVYFRAQDLSARLVSLLIMPTGGVDETLAQGGEWIKAGLATQALGMVRNLSLHRLSKTVIMTVSQRRYPNISSGPRRRGKSKRI